MPEGSVTKLGTDQLEGVPPIATATADARPAVEHDVLAAGVTQMVAHDEPGLPPPTTVCVDFGRSTIRQ